jgi:uncharacterized protein
VHAALGILSGFLGGILSGAFGVGGAILTTPAVQVLLGAPPIVAVGTPLPVILPTTLSGIHAYRRGGQIDYRAVRWAAPTGALGAVLGAAVTRVVNAHVLLMATAVLIGWQAVRVGLGRGGRDAEGPAGGTTAEPSPRALAVTGLVAGAASGMLGIGGGVVLVPVMAGVLGMPLKRTLGTSLVVIAVIVIPGTIVHAAFAHIDWAIFLWLSIGVVPGAALGSRWAVRARERTLRTVVGLFLGVVAVLYGALETSRVVASLAR